MKSKWFVLFVSLVSLAVSLNLLWQPLENPSAAEEPNKNPSVLEDEQLPQPTGIVLTRPTATIQVFPTASEDKWYQQEWKSSVPNVISVDKGVLWPLSPGRAQICLEGKCFSVESQPNWMSPRSPKHDHAPVPPAPEDTKVSSFSFDFY